MQKKLFYSGILSENVIENIINYVLIEIGQPIQAMNADKIFHKIVIRMARKTEKIILKSGEQIDLD
ncbi:MAG: B3/4 domain-containing protein, partial [Buchnera aphidicola]|nr:B3/4 domain-containing protein [Buchnera aphidicola]